LSVTDVIDNKGVIMKLMAALMLLNLADAPQVEIEAVSGQKTVGQVMSLDAAGWTIKTSEKEVKLDARSVLSMRLTAGAGTVGKRGGVEVVLEDGAHIGAKTIELDGKQATLESNIAGKLSLDRTVLASVRLVASPTAVDETWAELLKREKKQDMLVIRKGEVLDFVEGVIGKVTAEHVNLLLDDENVPVPRAKVFGLIFYQRASQKSAKASARVDFINGDRLLLRQVASDGTAFHMTAVTGAKFSVPINQVKELDLSFGKLKWLSDLEPRDIKHEFRLIDVGSEYEVNEDVDGGRLRIGNNEYTRGVSIRSKTEVRYRLDGDYNRFQSWVGIQKGYGGDVRIVIKADGKPLHNSIVKPNEKPVRIDLDVGGKYSLEVLVDYGTVQSDVGDHLVLADAVLLK
jgi:hypothetical protein